MPGPRGVTPSSLAGGGRSGRRRPACDPSPGPARDSASGRPGPPPALTCVWSRPRLRRRPEGPERPPGSGARGAAATPAPTRSTARAAGRQKTSSWQRGRSRSHTQGALRAAAGTENANRDEPEPERRRRRRLQQRRRRRGRGAGPPAGDPLTRK